MSSLPSSVEELGESDLSNPIGWTEDSKTLTTFTRFQEFPAEMRIKIYRLDLFRQRTLIVKACDNYWPEGEQVGIRRGWPVDFMNVYVKKIQCDTKNPALLFVNKETRMEALKLLSKLDVEPLLMNSRNFDIASFHLVNNKPLYANLHTDALAFGEGVLLKMMAEHQYAGLKSVALWYDSELFVPGGDRSLEKQFQDVFQDIDELTILMP